MKRSNTALLIAYMILLCWFPLSVFSDEISPEDPFIRYVGRFDFTEPKAPRMYWSGSHIIAWFEGTSCQVKLDSAGTDDFVNIIIDDGIPVKYNLGSGLETIAAANGLSEGTHKIEVFKRTSHQSGSIIFVGFITDDGMELAALPPAPAVKIEFYGDSITDGHSVDAEIDVGFNPTTWNNYLTYAAITARNLGMEYVSIASSGIAVLWPHNPGFIMDKYFDRIVPGDDGPSNAWDFSKFTPDIVVINLLVNDAFVNPSPHTTTEQDNIITAYENLLLKIRAEYPDAEIICTLGNNIWTASESVWFGYIESALDRMETTHSDSKVNSFFFTNEAPTEHPLASEHEEMAELLTKYIQTNLGHLFENVADPFIGGAPIPDPIGWYVSDWFGAYYTGLAPWLYHAEHGFVYRFPDSTKDGMYIYDDAMKTWWWTSESETVYPFIYAFDPPADNAGTDVEDAWLWYFSGETHPRIFSVMTGPNEGDFLYFLP